MRKFILLAGAAAMAAAMPALAKEGKGQGGGKPNKQVERVQQPKGNGRGNGRGAERAVQRQNLASPPNQQRQQARPAERSQRQAARNAERSQRQQMQAAERAAKDYRQSLQRQAKQERQQVNRSRVDDRLVRHAERARSADRRLADSRDIYRDFYRDGRARVVTAAVNGCPPGLAKKNHLCMPPGQFRKVQLIGQQPQFRWDNYNVPARYQYRFQDDSRHFYRYNDDGYVYRIDRGTGLISSIVPLYSTGLMVGEPLPLGYSAYNVPVQYRDRYYDTDDYFYRYDNGAIYRTNAQSGLVDGVVALLANQIGIGQPLPSGYDVYNVPLGYRDRYYDNDDYHYRYANGGIYQVDPTTRLVQALVELIV
jgi:hypothetical protein